MKRFLLYIFTVLFFSLGVLSCSEKEHEVRTDSIALGKLIDLPAKPVSVLWVAQNVVENSRVDLGPTYYYVNALIKLNDADYQKHKTAVQRKTL